MKSLAIFALFLFGLYCFGLSREFDRLHTKAALLRADIAECLDR